MGQEYDAFGPKTLREVSLILDGRVLKYQRDIKLARQGRYELAQLIAIGVNNPKEFPSQEEFFEEVPKAKAAASVEDLRAFFKEHGEQRFASE